MSAWDFAEQADEDQVARLTVPKAQGRHRTRYANGSLSKPDLSESLLESEHELVASSGHGRTGLRNVQVISEEDLIAEEARERERQLGRLNADVTKIHEVFADLAELVHGQSESVTLIERDVGNAHDRAEKGVKQLGKAAKHQKQGFRCCVVSLAVIAAIIVLIAVVIVLGAKYGGLAV